MKISSKRIGKNVKIMWKCPTALWLASLLLSSFPTEEDEDEVVLLADDCLRLRLTSSDLLSLDTEPEVVCEAKADCAVEDWFDEGADGADEDLPLEAVVFSSLAVSSVGRCCWLGTPLSWCIKDLASSQMPNLWPPFLTSLHRSQKRTTKFLASNFNSSI